MIKTLGKRLTHREVGLQTQAEEVARLEVSVADSERNRTFDFGTVPVPQLTFNFQPEKRVCTRVKCHRNGIRCAARWLPFGTK